MTPAAAISMLDRQLAAHGERVRLQRLTLGPAGIQVPFSVRCRAFVRGFEPEELVGGIKQTDSKVILSPTEIMRKAWPGPAIGQQPPGQDRRIPVKDDRVFIKGKPRNVDAATGIYLNGVLVRIEMRVIG